MYERLQNLIFQFANRTETIYTLGRKAENKIVKVDNQRIYVETNSSRDKYALGEKENPYRVIRKEWLLGALNKLLEKKSLIDQDLVEFGRRHSFLMAFLAALPFVEAKNVKDGSSIRLKEFTTADLPGPFNRSMNFMKEQKESALEIPFIRLIYDMLFYMDEEAPVREKRETLLEVMYLTIVSSTSGTQITESVAQRKLTDALGWLQNTGLVDENLNVIGQREGEMNSNSFWWVNQGKSAAVETEGGFLWAPKRAKNGTALAHHTDLTKAKPGDIVFAYSNGAIRSICRVVKEAVSANKPTSLAEDLWGVKGNLLEVQYYPLHLHINRDEIPHEWRLQEDGPFDRNGNVKQGYFYATSNEFANNLINLFNERIPEEFLEEVPLSGEHTRVKKFESVGSLVSHIHSYITNKGFYFTEENIKNLYLSLKTKPFVILSGISGTGKTKIVQLFAESVGATEGNGQFKLIPVRPDWSDGSDLIGFEDIKGDFKPGPLTDALVEANKPENRDKPYFILLDEMNLARVEYYFSDLLSVMESREKVDGEYVSVPVVDRPEVGRLMLRNNVFIIGTVNMDETTHPFSPKVLDRANTIEYNDVQLANFSIFDQMEEPQAAVVSNEQLAGEYITLKDAFADNEELIREVTDWLVEVNQILEQMKLHFGYRVRDEVCFYMIYNEQGQLMTKEQAFDLQLHQKVLTRVSGNDADTVKVLKELYTFCTGHAWDADIDVERESRFPQSAAKLANVIKKAEHEGFTSFWMG
ncbi:hypothetical protein J22TS1_05140 [Siminovitchia terrae]|uniref:McrB family protein n=1 Tax=Siminovitchia terrae TaxID=1914933 RepID=UPI001B00CFD1|nr:AAA family ATPase [Siminovitchia terrae]GIN89463.1 hypothetical protein J22TS1_05140 [Siminovitchia terrae]